MALDLIVQHLGIVFTVIFYSWAVYHILIFFKGLHVTFKGKDQNSSQLGEEEIQSLPSMTVIIPAKDEEAVIEGAINQALELRYPEGKKQIIVVEDGSTDSTPEICKRYADRYEEVIFVNSSESRGKAAALNRTTPYITGEIVCILDADTRMDKDFLLKAARYFMNHPEADALQALVRTLNGDENVITRLDTYEAWFWHRGILRGKDSLGLFVQLTGTGMFIRKRVLDAVGPWDEGCLAEDMDYARRIVENGGDVRILPADVWRQPPYTSRQFFKQRRRWWGGDLQVLFKRPAKDRRQIPLRRKVDMFISLASPVVMLLGSLLFFVSLAMQAFSPKIIGLFGMFFVGIITSHAAIFPLILAKAYSNRDASFLLLVPGLFYYWLLHFAALSSVSVSLLMRRKVRWEVTKKRKME